jgi:ketosteroid isomerase-like protein
MPFTLLAEGRQHRPARPRINREVNPTIRRCQHESAPRRKPDAEDEETSENQVAAQIVIELTYPSGGRVRDEEPHLWRFDGDHKIAALRHYVDTAKHIAAWNGEDTTRTT